MYLPDPSPIAPALDTASFVQVIQKEQQSLEERTQTSRFEPAMIDKFTENSRRQPKGPSAMAIRQPSARRRSTMQHNLTDAEQERASEVHAEFVVLPKRWGR